MKKRYLIKDITQDLRYEPNRRELAAYTFDTEASAWATVKMLTPGVYTVIPYIVIT